MVTNGWRPLVNPDRVGRDPAKLKLKGELARRRRRARLARAQSEPYSLAEIASRDRYRCGLCRRKVSMGLGYPDRRSASVDHLVPLSEGGNDTRANVQLAHLGCNLRKGVGGSQQLALLG